MSLRHTPTHVLCIAVISTSLSAENTAGADTCLRALPLADDLDSGRLADLASRHHGARAPSLVQPRAPLRTHCHCSGKRPRSGQSRAGSRTVPPTSTCLKVLNRSWHFLRFTFGRMEEVERCVHMHVHGNAFTRSTAEASATGRCYHTAWDILRALLCASGLPRGSERRRAAIDSARPLLRRARL